MSKVYGIFCDASLDTLLVGTGGTVSGQERRGWHLPGGTIEGGNFKGPKDPVPPVLLPDQLMREVREEFGAKRAQLLSRFITMPLDKFGLTLGDHSVYFVVCKVDVPLHEFVGEVKDGKNNLSDSCFELVQAVEMNKALKQFRVNNSTDWFADGVEYLNKHKELFLS